MGTFPGRFGKHIFLLSWCSLRFSASTASLHFSHSTYLAFCSHSSKRWALNSRISNQTNSIYPLQYTIFYGPYIGIYFRDLVFAVLTYNLILRRPFCNVHISSTLDSVSSNVRPNQLRQNFHWIHHRKYTIYRLIRRQRPYCLILLIKNEIKVWRIRYFITPLSAFTEYIKHSLTRKKFIIYRPVHNIIYTVR